MSNCRFLCKLCQETFNSELNLLVHFEAEHLQTDEISDCGDSDEDESGSEGDLGDVLMDVEKILLESSKTEEDIGPDPPEDCDEMDVGMEVDDEVGNQSLERPFNCGTCSKSYSTFQKLEEHVFMEQHKAPENIDKKPFVCSTCGNRFSTSHHLIRHMETHGKVLGKKGFPCQVCSKRFTRSEDMKKHMKKFHLGSVEELKCEVCEQSFSSMRDFKIHELTHKGNLHEAKPAFTCETCQEGYSTLYKLKEHLFKKRHTTNLEKINKKPYKCSVCESSFPTLFELQRHEKRHEDKGPPTFQCHVCKKELTRLDRLVKHLSSQHPGQELLECKICKKRFTRSDSLQRHLKTHDDNSKKHKCKLCTKGFGRPYGLTRHMNTVHKDQKSSKRGNETECESEED